VQIPRLDELAAGESTATGPAAAAPAAKPKIATASAIARRNS
jgi:hypothetical protein